MIIKGGYAGRVLELRIGADNDSRVANLDIDFTENKIKRDTLSYITLEELLDFKNEIDEAIKIIAKL